jgi:epoxyqueuosine reductase
MVPNWAECSVGMKSLPLIGAAGQKVVALYLCVRNVRQNTSNPPAYDKLNRVLTAATIRKLAAECGFELAGVAQAGPAPDSARYADWVDRGLAGEMRYLTDHRAQVRQHPNRLLEAVRSVISVGKYYGGPEPKTREFDAAGRAWISRYAWGEDYHDVLRRGLEALAARLNEQAGPFEWRACVDTAPILERSFAQLAGLGWIGKNTCLINEHRGSWFFLGELLVSLDIAPDAAPAAHRCGNCTRCIEACPTQALVPRIGPDAGWELDARLCISYFTIELRTDIPEPHRTALGPHVFGCDICQDVCPWNERAERLAVNQPAAEFRPKSASMVAPPLAEMAALTEADFRALFRGTPVTRAKHAGFLRNVVVAMGNSGNPAMAEPLRRLTAHENAMVARHAQWALRKVEPD